MRPAKYITYRELFDHLPTKTDVEEILSGLNAFHTVLLAARLNTMFWHSVRSQNPDDIDTFQSWFAISFLAPETRQRLEERFGPEKPGSRPLCHPLQLLNVVRLALVFSQGDENARP